MGPEITRVTSGLPAEKFRAPVVLDRPCAGKTLQEVNPGPEEGMKRWALFLIAGAWGLTSCATISTPETLTGISDGLSCIPYEKGMEWARVSETLKAPEIIPAPEPSAGLEHNARIFTHPVVILYVDNEEFKEGEKVRFREVVNRVELCTRKK